MVMLLPNKISDILAFNIIIEGHSKSIFVVEVGESLESEPKQTGGGRSSLSVQSLCEKSFLIFQTANRVLSDKLPGICLMFLCFEPSPGYKDVFLLNFVHLTFFDEYVNTFIVIIYTTVKNINNLSFEFTKTLTSFLFENSRD